MRHRIAIFSNGFNGSITLKAIEGIRKYAAIKDFDTHFYVGFAAYSEDEQYNIGQFNIYKLADLEEYDGLIVFSGLLNNTELARKACLDAKERDVPVVSIGMEIEGIPYVGINNRDGMKDLVEHLVTEHNVRNVVYIGGARGHVDTIERGQVVSEVLESHGLKLEEKNYYYGDWVNERAIDITDRLASDPAGLPDAIICANDIMALAVITELSNKGYTLPDDTIVTGFDHIEEGTASFPALTTVDQDYVAVGYNSCKLLYDIVEGKTDGNYSAVSSKLFVGESCRCNTELDGDFALSRREYCRGIHNRSKMADFFNRYMDEEKKKILESKDYESMKAALREFYSCSQEYSGDNYYIALNRKYFEDVVAEDCDTLADCYEAEFDYTVALLNGAISEEEIDGKIRLPGFVRTPGEQHIYSFYPLHNQQYSYGFVVFRDGTYMLEESFRVHEYLQKLKHTLQELRINMRLEMAVKELRFLYDKDPMTGLYNRFCFVSHAVPLMETSKEHGKKSMILFADINYMKKINDGYGHIYGDKAITIVANAIRKSIEGREAIGIRYGGDEFVVIAADADEAFAEKVKHDMNAYIEKENKLGVNPFTLSISIGYVLTDPDADKSVDDYVDEADALMYEIKNQYHKEHPKD